jgi:predicted flap endonuclease-1-like 5' DNA nuclease
VSLWASEDPSAWRRALDSYEAVIERQGIDKLPERDRWYRQELPRLITARDPAHVTLDDLVRVTEWKMTRGVWRGRNLVLVKGNAPEAVVDTSARALALAPDPKRPVTVLTRLAGVGPATASAVAAAAFPGTYPFFDEIAAAQVPGLGRVAYSPAFYGRYADALRSRAKALGAGWTPSDVERALWARAGGKAGG